MGRVIPSSQLQVVSNLEGGVVQDILVRAGQLVRAGDELIRLDRTQTGAEFGSGEATLTALDIKIARLQAEVDGPRAGLSRRRRSADRRPDPDRAARCTPRAWPISPACIGAGAARGSARPSAASPRPRPAYQARVTTYEQRRSEARIIRPLVERGIEPRLSLIQAESAADVAQSEMAGGGRGRRPRPLRRRRGARRAWPSSSSEWRAQAATELATAQAEFAARQRALPALADRARRTVLRAPLAGRINRVLVTTRRRHRPRRRAGGRDRAVARRACWSRRGCCPTTSPSSASARRRGSRSPPTTGRSTACSKAGWSPSRPTRCSTSAPARPSTRSASAPIRTRCATPTAGRLPIGAGMVAEVDLLGEKRTILQYILSPITRLSETAFREQ